MSLGLGRVGLSPSAESSQGLDQQLKQLPPEQHLNPGAGGKSSFYLFSSLDLSLPPFYRWENQGSCREKAFVQNSQSVGVTGDQNLVCPGPLTSASRWAVPSWPMSSQLSRRGNWVSERHKQAKA